MYTESIALGLGSAKSSKKGEYTAFKRSIVERYTPFFFSLFQSLFMQFFHIVNKWIFRKNSTNYLLP